MLIKQARVWVSSTSLLASSLIIMRRIFTDPFGGIIGNSPAGYSSNFFSAQAASLLQGHLYVDPLDIPGECYIFRDRCFGYYGIAPSLMRIPLVAQLRDSPGQITFGFSNIMMLVALVTGLAASIWLVDHYWSKYVFASISDAPSKVSQIPISSLALYTSLIFIAGPGNLLLQITRPAVYEEAIAWSVAFLMLTIIFVVKFFECFEIKYIYASTVFMVMAANSRPTAYIPSIILPILIFLVIHKYHPKMGNRKVILPLVLMSLAPVGTASLVFFIKFRTIFPSLSLNEQVPEAQHWLIIYTLNGQRDFSLRFMPTNLFTYFNPNPEFLIQRLISISQYLQGSEVSSSPMSVHWIWPISEGSLYVERTISIFVLSPILLFFIFFGIFCFLKLIFRKAVIKIELWIILISLFGSVLTVTSAVSISNRYVADFVPLISIIVVISSLLSHTFVSEHKRIQFLFTLCVFLLGSVSVASNLVGLSL